MQSKPVTPAVLRACTLLSTALLMAGFITNPAQGITITLEPSIQTVSPGDFVEISLQISGLGNGSSPSLGTFDLFLGFNPGVLHYESVLFGDMIGPVAGSLSGSVINQTGGSLNLFAVSLDTPADLDALQPRQFMLASILFSVSGVGSSTLDLSNNHPWGCAGSSINPRRLQWRFGYRRPFGARGRPDWLRIVSAGLYYGLRDAVVAAPTGQQNLKTSSSNRATVLRVSLQSRRGVRPMVPQPLPARERVRRERRRLPHAQLHPYARHHAARTARGRLAQE